MPSAAPPWMISGLVATPAPRGRLDLGSVRDGIVVDEAGDADRLLGIDLGAAVGPADHWVRAGDLTAVYEPPDSRRLRATAMWRVRPGAVAAWELVVSAQTSLLHADAALAVVSDVAADEVFVAAGDGTSCGRWSRLPAGAAAAADTAFVLARRRATSALVAVHPRDPRRIDVTRAAGRTRIACGMFPASIEKGVILRSRVLAAVGPAGGDEAWAAALATAFAGSPPFLDT